MNVVFFPDAEVEAVKGLRSLVSLSESLNVRVATQRRPDDYKGVEAILRADGYTLVSRVTKELDMAITIYSSDDDYHTRYQAANDAALALEGLVYALPKYSSISGVTDVTSIPVEDPSSEREVRYLTFTVILKGTTVNL